MDMRLISFAVLLTALAAAPAVASGPPPAKNGLTEIADPELNLMRGRYTVGGNAVAWFGVTMVSQWQAANGSSLEAALTLGMDFRGGATPTISFAPSVKVTAADAPLPVAAATAQVDSTGLANPSGLVQSVQVAGDGNVARNATALLLRDGDVPPSVDGGTRSATVQQGEASATALFDNNQARLQLQVQDAGAVQQWIRNGSVGQSIALSGDAHQASNRLQIELVRQTVIGGTPLGQNVAQAMAMTRGMGPGQ